MTARRAAGKAAETPPELGRETQEANAILGELLGTATGDPTAELYLYRILPRAQNVSGPSYLKVYLGQAPTLEEIADTYGGGTYRVMLKRGIRKEFAGAAVFSIEGQPIFARRETAGQSSPSAGAAAAGDGGELEHRLARIEAMLGQVAGGAPRGSVEDEDARDRREFRRMLREHLILRAFSEQATPAPASSPANDPLALVERLMDVYDRVRETEAERELPGWQDGLAQAAIRFLGSPETAGGNGAPSSPRALPAPAAPSAADRERGMLERLERAARAEEDPASLADWALALLPADFVKRIPALTPAHFLAVFQSMPFPAFADPGVQAWLLRFRLALLERVTPDAGSGTARPEERGARAPEEPEQQEAEG